MGVNSGGDEDEGERKDAERGVEPGCGKGRRGARQLDEAAVSIERGMGGHHDRGQEEVEGRTLGAERVGADRREQQEDGHGPEFRGRSGPSSRE